MAALLTKELRQMWRSFRLPALYLTLLFLAVLDPLSTRYMGEIIGYFAQGQGVTVAFPPPSAEQAVGSFVGDIVEIGLLVIVAITMGSVAGERAAGVTTFIVTKPASRGSYVLAKLIVLGAGIGLGVAASLLITWLYTWSLIGPLPFSRVALSGLSIGVYAQLIMIATFSASMALPGSLAAGAAGIGFTILMGIAGAALGKSAIGPYLPSALMGNATLLLSGASGGSTGPGGLSGSISLLLRPGIAAVMLSVALLVAAFSRFRRTALQ